VSAQPPAKTTAGLIKKRNFGNLVSYEVSGISKNRILNPEH